MPVQTLRQKTYNHLRDKLVSGQLSAGTLLMEPALAKEVGVSRTPVREAFRQLEMEGFVESIPRYGVIVRKPSREDFAEMFAVREALETYAVAEAAARITDVSLQDLSDLLERMKSIANDFSRGDDRYLQGENLDAYLEADKNFHQIVSRAAGNRYMSKLMDDTKLLANIFRASLWEYDRSMLDEANLFHKRLFDALQARDADTAKLVTIEAMKMARKNSLERFE